ncbi:DUF6624 domain-containing protein [Christiangramia flava]|uniref:Uncharacterized protein n=1 Tax=Christiangramia flava JLT2011 TaxID=1229726 RepID=A0A1L7I8W1_9FLAO|nr:DUF6624 domain-containing protein [Christiangramia flava]APU69545.1 hypothetical protein GRFL_2821 [Christiangramia flava JLT2011]OSS37470.1 hypothetical protein C723_3615 [Christiangramia flava JLT2011]
MNKICGILILAILIIGCKEDKKQKQLTSNQTKFNQELAKELRRIAEIDQIAAYIPQGEYKKLSQEEWNEFKDSVFTTNQKRIEEIFNEYGFVGYDLVGEKGSQDFWLVVQHSDHNPEFQKKVLEKMKQEVEQGNADSKSYALLVDRVKLNTGKRQIYGTQVDYNFKLAQAYPKKLADSLNVNQRRKSVGLEPIEVYLNRMSEMHFEMNKEGYIKNGINEPKLYEVD